MILRLGRPVEIGGESLPIWKAKQPLLAVALLFATGIVLQYTFRVPWNPFLLVAVGGALAWMMISWNTLSPPRPIAPLVMVVGSLLTAAQCESLEGFSPSHLRQLVRRLPQHLVLRGIVRTDPAHRVHERNSSRLSGSDNGKNDGMVTVYSEFQLHVSAVKFHTVWEPSCGTVQVRLRSPLASPTARRGEISLAVAKFRPPRQDLVGSDGSGSWERTEPSGSATALTGMEEIEFGQEVEVEGVLGEPPAARNFGLFDYAAYLHRQGIHYALQADGSDSVHILGPALGGGWIFAARQKLAEQLTLGIEDDTLAVGIIRGMLLGYREDIPPDVNDSFRRSGTLHVFAISGSHITLIALALLIALRQLRVPRNWVCCLVLPALIFYVVATGLRASAVRSLVMAAVVILGWSLERPSALLNNLAVSALIILSWDPLQLFDAGFQLSFVVVASLILVAPVIDRKIQSWFEPDPYIPRSYLPRWRLALMPPCRWLAALMAVCLAAWVGSFGLNLYYFNLISFVAILANLLIVPLASASVGLGLVSLLLGLAWDQLAITLNTTHALLVHTMVAISEGLAGSNHGYVYVAQPHVGWIVAGYTLSIVIALLWMKKHRVSALILTTAFIATVGSLVFAAWNTDRIRLDIMDVGSGQSVLITGPRFERVLVDAGSKSQGRMVVEPFLRSRGVNVIDLAVISHGDAAHYGGFQELLGNVPIRRIAIADTSFRSTGYKQLLTQIEKAGIPLKKWKKGDEEMLRSGRILALRPPGNTKAKRADDQGLVLELKTKFAGCLFASDSGEIVEKAIVNSGLDPGPILIQGIHSNEESITQPYLDILKPLVIVLNTAEYPSSTQPSQEMQRRLQQTRACVFQTDQSGGVIISLGSNGIFLMAFLSKDTKDFPLFSK